MCGEAIKINLGWSVWSSKQYIYALSFASDSRKLFKIGVNFSSEIWNAGKWKVVTVEKTQL